jgi:hypothetical protein
MASSRQNGSLAFDTTDWPLARLIPTAGIRGQEEQEERATSSLLAVMRAVPEFGHALLKELGAPKSPVIDMFAEVRFKDGAGKTVIPDGAIVCRRGQKVWRSSVAVVRRCGRAWLRSRRAAPSCVRSRSARTWTSLASTLLTAS